MSFEEKVKYLEEKGVEVKDIISCKNMKEEEWVITYEDLTDMGPYGGYPISDSYDTAEEAVDAAITILKYGADVYNISYGW